MEHDLQDLEPRCDLPDAIDALSEAERETSARVSDDLCALWGTSADDDRWFVRALIPFSVRDRAKDCCWSIWVEVTQSSFDEIRALWNEPEQLEHAPWPAQLANDAVTYPSTLGIRGAVRFVAVDQLPRFAPDPEQSHPFVQDWVSGVPVERVAAWQLAFLH